MKTAHEPEALRMKTSARRPGSHGAGRRAPQPSPQAGPALGSQSALPASVGRCGPAVTRRRQPVPHLRNSGHHASGNGSPGCSARTQAELAAGTPLPPQLLAPSPSPTPQGQRAAPEDQMACGHWPWPQVPAEKSIPASSWAGLSLA